MDVNNWMLFHFMLSKKHAEFPNLLVQPQDTYPSQTPVAKSEHQGLQQNEMKCTWCRFVQSCLSMPKHGFTWSVTMLHRLLMNTGIGMYFNIIYLWWFYFEHHWCAVITAVIYLNLRETNYSLQQGKAMTVNQLFGESQLKLASGSDTCSDCKQDPNCKCS